MSLDINKLENVERRGSHIIARCPACAEHGYDNKGEHLSIDEEGRFTCVVYPQDTGIEHRKQIFALVGVRGGCGGSHSQHQNKMIKVKKPMLNCGFVIKSNILGHLGQVSLTHVHIENNRY